MGVPVKIAGADSIDVPAPARDPGVTATPADFGSDIGVGMQHLGDAAVAVGAHLYQKQQAASDQVYADTYNVSMAPATQETIQRVKAQYPNGGPELTQALNDQLLTTHDQVVQGLADKGITPSNSAMAAVKHSFNGVRANALVAGVTFAHNQKITSLQTQQDDNVDTVKSQVLSGNMSLDDGLKTVDGTVNGSKGLFSGTELTDRKDKWQQGVVDAAIENRVKAGDLAAAKSIRDKYYGGAPRAGTMSIYDAIHQQESGGGANTSTSVTGARGDMQIQPATFKQYAQPGESIDSKADNIAVGKRIIDDLSVKSGGDPARIAVGYFSGPGNIAPPGSPTPWKRDYADPTGKTVSSYVSDILKRTSGQTVGKPVKVASIDGGVGQPNADASGDTSDASSGDNAPVLPNVKKSLYWDQQISAATFDAKQAEQAQSAAMKKTSDDEELSVMKDIHSENPTIPARDIWNNPKLSLAAKEKLFNVKTSLTGGEKADKTYGPGFYGAYQKVHAAEGDPNKITDPTSLYSRVGPQGDLTVAGVDKLVSEINGSKTPEGVAEAEMKKQFLTTAKGQISGSDEGLHIKDPKGDQLYLKFLAQAWPAYDAGRKAGKSAAQLLNPDSPDYVGKSIKSFTRPMDQWFSDMVNNGSSPAVSTGGAKFDPALVKSLDDLTRAYKVGNVSREVASQIAIDRGWAVRAPTPAAVPVSQ